jgi:hypothetical protein
MDKDLKRIIEESLNATFKSGIPISGEEKYFKQQPGGTFGTSNVDGIMQELQSIDEDAFRIYNDTLCPALWNESLHLDPAVRSGLLKVAEDFYEKTGFKAQLQITIGHLIVTLTFISLLIMINFKCRKRLSKKL